MLGQTFLANLEIISRHTNITKQKADTPSLGIDSFPLKPC